MYKIFREGISMGIIDTKPTQEQLSELNCDSYEEYVEPEETIEAKKTRIFSSLVASSNIGDVDLEGITFSNIEIGDIIQARVFGGNPHAESALQAKVSAYIFSVMNGEPNEELRAEIEDKQNKVNEVRLKLGLSSILQ